MRGAGGHPVSGQAGSDAFVGPPCLPLTEDAHEDRIRPSWPIVMHEPEGHSLPATVCLCRFQSPAVRRTVALDVAAQETRSLLAGTLDVGDALIVVELGEQRIV